MLSRRHLLTAAAALPFISIGDAVAATTLDQYIVLIGDDSSAENTGTGIRLRAGAYNNTAAGVRLFSKAFVPAGTGQRRYALTREIIPQIVTSNGAWFNVGIVWGTHVPAQGDPIGDNGTAPLYKGWRITHANKDPEDRGLIKLRTYPNRTQISPAAQKRLIFALNAKYEIVLKWNSNKVTFSIPAISLTSTWTHASLKVASNARLMFYASPGTGYHLENVRA